MEADLEGPVNFVRKPMHPDRSLDCALLAECAVSKREVDLRHAPTDIEDVVLAIVYAVA